MQAQHCRTCLWTVALTALVSTGLVAVAPASGSATSALPASGACTATPWRDLGTLGGDRTIATALNNRGEIVGVTSNAGDVGHAFVWRDGVMTDLTPGAASGAAAINDRGEIAGDMFLDGTGQYAVVWRDGVPTLLGTLGGSWSGSRGINNRGEVIGTSALAGHDADPGQGFVWRNGVMTRLPGRGAIAVPNDINGRGDIVGFLENPDGSPRGAALWRRGRLIGLRPTFGDPDTAVATKVNNRGDVLGSVYVPGSDSYHGFLWSGGVFTDLGRGIPRGLNDRGEVAFIGYTDWLSWAARWSRGTLTPLPTLGSMNGQVSDINNQVSRPPVRLGWACRPAGRGGRPVRNRVGA